MRGAADPGQTRADEQAVTGGRATRVTSASGGRRPASPSVSDHAAHALTVQQRHPQHHDTSPRHRGERTGRGRRAPFGLARAGAGRAGTAQPPDAESGWTKDPNEPPGSRLRPPPRPPRTSEGRREPDPPRDEAGPPVQPIGPPPRRTTHHGPHTRERRRPCTAWMLGRHAQGAPRPARHVRRSRHPTSSAVTCDALGQPPRETGLLADLRDGDDLP